MSFLVLAAAFLLFSGLIIVVVVVAISSKDSKVKTEEPMIAVRTKHKK